MRLNAQTCANLRLNANPIFNIGLSCCRLTTRYVQQIKRRLFAGASSLQTTRQINLTLVTAVGLLISTATTDLAASGMETLNNSGQIITHQQHQAATVINRQTLKAIYTLRRQYWDDGTPIRLFTLPAEHPLHKCFTRQQLGFYPYQLQRYWDRLAFSGTAIEPIEVASEAAMIDAVKTHKGAIGYISNNVAAKEVGRVHLH